MRREEGSFGESRPWLVRGGRGDKGTIGVAAGGGEGDAAATYNAWKSEGSCEYGDRDDCYCYDDDGDTITIIMATTKTTTVNIHKMIDTSKRINSAHRMHDVRIPRSHIQRACCRTPG